VTFTRTGTGEPETVGLAGEIARTWVRCDELAKKLKVLPVHLNPRAFLRQPGQSTHDYQRCVYGALITFEEQLKNALDHSDVSPARTNSGP